MGRIDIKNNNSILAHFEEIAKSYDSYKMKNSYYYAQSKKLYKELIPDSGLLRIVELGCGSGEIINSLSPKVGVGIDLSPKMIDIAQEKYQYKSNLRFFSGSIDNLSFMKDIFVENDFDYCIIPDTLEHLPDMRKAFYVLSCVVDKKVKIIITSVNPLWVPLLELLEFLRLKMPEGPHTWPNMKEVISTLESNCFKILQENYSILVPFNILIISDWLNRAIRKAPILRRLCLIQYIVCQLK